MPALHLLPIMHVVKKAHRSKNQDEKWGLKHIITVKTAVSKMSIQDRKKWSLEKCLTEVVTMTSQVSISVAWVLGQAYIYYSDDVNYLQNPRYFNNFFNIFNFFLGKNLHTLFLP